jgi:hypothetical protein
MHSSAAPRKRQRKKTTPGRSKATRFTHKKFRWLNQLSLDAELSDLALRVCVQLCAAFNLDYGGAAWLFQDTLAARLGVRREKINKAIALLVARGHLESIRQGRDKPNVYRMVLKDEAAPIEAPTTPTDRSSRCAENDTSSPPMMCPLDVPETGFRCAENGTQTPFKTPGSLPKKEGFQGRGERESVAQERDYSSPAVAAALEGPRAEEQARLAREEEKEESKQAQNAGGGGMARPPAVNGEIIPPGSFEELRAIYDRGHLDDDEAAREAFERACQRGAEPEEIIEGARVWVAAADAPRFLKPLDVWLDRQGWTKSPPQRAAKQATRGRSSHHRNGRKVDMAKVALEYGGYVEQEDGSMVFGGDQ